MKFLKIIWFILLGMIVFLGGQIAGTNLKYQLDMAKSRRNVEKAQEMLLEPYKNDTYGGSTPQETFDLFLDALKKDDLELASKYFTSRRRAEELEGLKKRREDGTLGDFIEKLENSRETWAETHNEFYDWKERAEVSYKTHEEERVVRLPRGGREYETLKLPAGEYENPIMFLRNSYTNIWKIDIL